jgi:hypothetical protein
MTTHRFPIGQKLSLPGHFPEPVMLEGIRSIGDGFACRVRLPDGTPAAISDHMLLLTATPHHGDDDRFAHFIRLLDPDLFLEPHRVGDKAREIRRDIENTFHHRG